MKKYLLLSCVVLGLCGAGYAATFTSTEGGEHALSLTSGSATYTGITVTKTGDGGGDDDFSGANAAVFASGGARLTIKGPGSTITTNGENAHAVFSSGGKITISDTAISTQDDYSSGLMVNEGGSIEANNLTVTAQSKQSPAVIADGGSIVIKKGTYTAGGSFAAILWGGSSVSLTEAALNAEDAGNAIWFRTRDGSNETSTFSMSKGSLPDVGYGVLFLADDGAKASIVLSEVAISNTGTLLVTYPESNVTFKATNQTLKGSIFADGMSTLSLTIAGSSTYTGAVNPKGQQGIVSVSVGSGSTWTLTKDSYISSLTNKGTINMGDYTLYVDGTAYDGTSTSVGGDTAYGTAPTITTTELGDATVGKSYSASLKAEGTKPITWTTDESSLPEGMTFSSTGKLSGRPAEAGSYSLEFTASNNAGSDIVVLDLSVNDQKPKIKGSVKTGIIDEEYLAEFTLTAGTGDIDWAIAGDLPDGLEFSSDEDTAQISGTPTEVWDGKITISASNETGGTGSKTFTLKVKMMKPKIGIRSLPAVMAGEEVSASLDITGTKPITVTLFGAPEGFAYDPESDMLTGTPAVAGKYSIKVVAENAAGKASKTLKLTVNSAPVIGDVSLEEGTTGKSYNYSFTATGSTPIRWSVDDTDSLPAGITLTSKGKLKGKPIESGTFTFTVTAENAYGSDEKEAALTIKPVPPEISTKSLKKGTAGKAYSVELSVKGSQPITWEIQGELPEGITFEDGVFSGTCGSAFSGSVTVTATNDGGTASRTYTLTISAVAPKITTKSLPSGTHGVDYSAVLEATGTPDIVWSWETSKAPAGLAINSETGEISGTPIAAGT